MFRHNLLIAIRNFKRHKGSFFINLIGLSTGLACSFLILVWVENELSFDRFHQKWEDIYRVTAEVKGEKSAFTGAPLANAMRTEMPEVENTVRIRPTFGAETVFAVGDNKKFDEKAVIFADSTFFQVFSFPLLQGESKTVLMQPDGLVLTRRMAIKYFGSTDAIGKTVRINDTDNIKVVGVLKDLPANSHLQFDFLLPMSHLARTDQDIRQGHWANLGFNTYVLLRASSDMKGRLEKTINRIYKKNDPTFEAIFRLQPLSEIHLHSSDFILESEGSGNIQNVRIFSIIAAFILLVACVNFVNLATARSTCRSKEVGLRKAIGAARSQLLVQFLGESFLIMAAAFLLATGLVALGIPSFDQILGKPLMISLTDGRLYIGMFAIFIITTLIAGFYPAFFLSAFQPTNVLKEGNAKAGNGRVFLTNGLVVFQFVISIVLITGTAVVYSQVRLIQSKNLGYDRENLLYIPLKGELDHNIRGLRAEILNNPSLGNCSIVSRLPVDMIVGTIGVVWEGKDMKVLPMFSVMGVDESFLDVFKVRLISGRGFSKGIITDSNNYMINEKALRTMGYDATSAIGKPLTVWGHKGTIVGVVKDFNFKSLQQSIDPLVLKFYSPGIGYAAIRTRPGGSSQAIDQLRLIWQKLNPTYGFDYGFVDQDLNNRYKVEYRMAALFNFFALLAILISCLGLVGLASFTAQRRIKEVGIRKTLGASTIDILVLLSKNFIWLVAIAILIAIPLAWIGANKWLEEYAFRIKLEWWIFVGAGLIAMIIALFTVSAQLIKAALRNPVLSLRNE